MAQNLSMYRNASPTAVVYHNKSGLPSINIPHMHSEYEIYYNISGAEGFFLDKNYYACLGNDLFVVPKVSVHKALINADTAYERCIISIDSEIIAAINSMPHMKGTLDWMDYVGGSITGKVNLGEKEHMYFMDRISKYNTTPDELKKFSVLIEILSLVSHKFKTTPPEPTDKPESIVGKALLLMEENFHHIKISEIAGKLYVSNSHFSKIFTEQCGVTPINYLLIRKIAEAKKYLHMGISVKEACLLSGFSDYSNFIRTFKNIEGCPPGSFERLSKPY